MISAISLFTNNEMNNVVIKPILIHGMTDSRTVHNRKSFQEHYSGVSVFIFFVVLGAKDYVDYIIQVYVFYAFY